MAHELGISGFMVAALSIASLLQVAMAAQYYVGGSTGWDFVPTPSFYSDWAAAINFFPGDQLVFKYTASNHDVQEVSQADFAACNGLAPVNQYQSGNDVITLTKPGTFFYICGFLGHCDGGGMLMKVAVNPSPPPPPAITLPPPPPTNHPPPPIAISSPPPPSPPPFPSPSPFPSPPSPPPPMKPIQHPKPVDVSPPPPLKPLPVPSPVAPFPISHPRSPPPPHTNTPPKVPGGPIVGLHPASAPWSSISIAPIPMSGAAPTGVTPSGQECLRVDKFVVIVWTSCLVVASIGVGFDLMNSGLFGNIYSC